MGLYLQIFHNRRYTGREKYYALMTYKLENAVAVVRIIYAAEKITYKNKLLTNKNKIIAIPW